MASIRIDWLALRAAQEGTGRQGAAGAGLLHDRGDRGQRLLKSKGGDRRRYRGEATEAEGRGEDPEEIKSPDWVIHDLWRTVAANLQKLGVRLEVTEAVLNHVSGSRAGIVGIYQRHEWATEKPQALDVWARRLDAIVSGKMATDGADKRESSAGRSRAAAGSLAHP